jgi:hypothetical protein
MICGAKARCPEHKPDNGILEPGLDEYDGGS